MKGDKHRNQQLQLNEGSEQKMATQCLKPCKDTPASLLSIERQWVKLISIWSHKTQNSPNPFILKGDTHSVNVY